jgi:hypothetical protein
MTKFDRFRAWVHATANDEITKAITELKADFYKKSNEQSTVIYKRLRSELEIVIKRYINQKIDEITTKHFVDLLKAEMDTKIEEEVKKLKNKVTTKMYIGGKR